MSFFNTIMGRNNTQTPTPAVAPATPPTPEEPINPLDHYKKIFDNAASKEGDTQGPQFNLDTNVLNDVGSKINFMNSADPELVRKATSGDAGSMLELMNIVAQNAYKTALSHGTSLTGAHLTSRDEEVKKSLGGVVKNSLIDNELSQVPNAKHPVVRQELVRIAEALAKDNPDASPAQIKEEALRYFNSVYKALNPAQPEPQTETAGQVQDWEKFLLS
jgi:hypothetical protein